jgi:hypothetical protein
LIGSLLRALFNGDCCTVDLNGDIDPFDMDLKLDPTLEMGIELARLLKLLLIPVDCLKISLDCDDVVVGLVEKVVGLEGSIAVVGGFIKDLKLDPTSKLSARLIVFLKLSLTSVDFSIDVDLKLDPTPGLGIELAKLLKLLLIPADCL